MQKEFLPPPRHPRAWAWRVVTPAAVLACALLAWGRPAAAQDAKAILKSMGDYVSAQQTITLSFDSSIEVITPELEKIQFTSSGNALVARPDRLRARRTGGNADVELVFDGKKANIVAHSLEAFASFDAPGTIDQLLTALRTGRGLGLPGADLLYSNAYDLLAAEVMEAKFIGAGVVGGVVCSHLAFRNFDTDWQIWIEEGDRPIPRKLVVTSKTMAAAPQYTLVIKDWQSNAPIAADAFVFTPPAGAKPLEPDQLLQLDELPPSAAKPGGGR